MTELYLVRHGETVGNSAVHLYGRTDIALSDSGREQMRCVGEALRDVAFGFVFASPLQRSIESAGIVMQGRTLQPVACDEFMEIDFGNWEGWSLAHAEERDPENYHAWKTTGAEFRFPGGEMKRDFFARSAEAAKRVFNKQEGRILAVLHKGIIKGAHAGLLGLPVDEFVHHRIELGSIHVLRRENGAWSLVESNQVDHLTGCRIPDSG